MKKKDWELRITVRIIRAGRIIAAVMAELTPVPEGDVQPGWNLVNGVMALPRGDVHQASRIAAVMPPGDCHAAEQDHMAFGHNRFVIDRVELLNEGPRVRRKYHCRRIA
jgi:hypothetical protein